MGTITVFILEGCWKDYMSGYLQRARGTLPCQTRLALGSDTRLLIDMPPWGDPWGFCLKNPALGSLIASHGLNFSVLTTSEYVSI